MRKRGITHMLNGTERIDIEFLQRELLGKPLYGKAVTLHCIFNPDGTVRWIYPAGSRSPYFLKFYTVSGWKSRIFTALIKILFRLHLSRFVKHGSLQTDPAHIRQFLGVHKMPEAWAMFTGTAGPGRKFIAAIKEGTGLRFVKIPVTEFSKSLVAQEIRALHFLHTLQPGSICVPELLEEDPGHAVFSDIGKGAGRRITEPSALHWQAIASLFRKTHQLADYSSEFWEETHNQVDTLQEMCSRVPRTLVEKLVKLRDHLQKHQPVHIYFAHGDFTPWNQYVRDDMLHVYDWEMASEQPAWFDMFHFICQTGILLKHKNYAAIRRDIDACIRHIDTDAEIANADIPARLYFSFYMLRVTAYYLTIYEVQETWHTQVHWLLLFWENAMDEELAWHDGKTQRAQFLGDLFGYLRNQDYALLKFHAESPGMIAPETDLDMVVGKGVVPAVHTFAKEHAFTEKTAMRRNSMMCTLDIYFRDSGMLSIDMLHTIRRKRLIMLDANTVLQHSTMHMSGVKIPIREHDLIYTWLFYMLNGAAVPDKYIRYYNARKPATSQHLLETFNEVFGTEHGSWESAFAFNPENYSHALQFAMQHPSNGGIRAWKYRLQYIWDVLKNMRLRKGIAITFSGVDGAGKSTVIEHVRLALEKQYRRRVIVLRHRPGLLPILSAWKYGKKEAEMKAASTLPRQGTNTSRISSLLRFAYYYTDYLFGQFYIWFRYLSRGYVVLYDRYYFDFIHDARRSNIHLPDRFTRPFYYALIKPKLNFFLYAPAEIITLRKQELSPDTITALTERYNRLFLSLHRRHMRSQYISIQNLDLGETTQTILTHYQKAV